MKKDLFTRRSLDEGGPKSDRPRETVKKIADALGVFLDELMK